MNWKNIILLISISAVAFLGILYYLGWRDKQSQQKEELGQSQTAKEGITPLTSEEKEKILQESIPESPIGPITEEEREQMLKY